MKTWGRDSKESAGKNNPREGINIYRNLSKKSCFRMQTY